MLPAHHKRWQERQQSHLKLIDDNQNYICRDAPIINEPALVKSSICYEWRLI